MRILVVEDDPLVRELVESYLVSLGYDVTGAASGAEALEILEKDSDFALLFTDLIMPGGVLGTELAEKARAINGDLRILFTTGYADEAMKEDHKGILATAHMVKKPYRRADLGKKIKEVLEA